MGLLPIPIKPIMPIIAMKVKGWPKPSNEGVMPQNTKGKQTRMSSTFFQLLKSNKRISRMMKNEGSTTPSVAISAPGKPPCDDPIKVAILIASGPGVDSETATKLRNSASVSQP